MVLLELKQYLKADELKELGTQAILRGKEAEYSEQENQYGKRNLNIPVEFSDGQKRIWSPNITSQINLSKVYGYDTDQWEGQLVRFEIIQVQTKNGLKPSIIGKPIEEKVK